MLSDSYHVNPQYTVEVVDADDADEDDKGTLIVALMQVGRRKKKQPFLPIGYMIYPVCYQFIIRTKFDRLIKRRGHPPNI